MLDPELAFGELYMDGELLIEQGSIADLFALLFDQPDRLLLIGLSCQPRCDGSFDAYGNSTCAAARSATLRITMTLV